MFVSCLFTYVPLVQFEISWYQSGTGVGEDLGCPQGASVEELGY